jgi:choice-of-anchor C domain-containing protein
MIFGDITLFLRHAGSSIYFRGNFMLRTLSAAALLVASTCGVNAATITNGDFELPGTFSGGFAPLSAGSTAIAGWSIDSGSVDLINTYWYNASGNYSIDLSGGGPATISQTVTGLVKGNWYSIFFDLAGNPAGGSVVKSLTAVLGSVGGGTFTFDTTGQTLATMGWLTQSFAFQANSTSALLSFTSNENSAYGPALDNVRIAEKVAAVPVPAAGGLMVAGLGLLGFMRRRKRVTA